MELGYARDLPFYKAADQERDLRERKPKLKIYIEGRGAEDLDAVIMAFRKSPGLVLLATDMRVLADSQQEILAVYKRLKHVDLVVLDTKTGERSDRDGVEMRHRAAAGLQRDRSMGRDPKAPKKRGRRGGIRKGEVAAEERAKIASEAVIRRICEHPKLTWQDCEDILGVSKATLRRRYRDEQ